MRWLVLAMLACGGPQRAPAPAQTFEGRIVDETGAPLSGAEILICTYGCGSIATYLPQFDTLHETIEHAALDVPRATIALATTAAGGQFRVTLAPDPVAPHEPDAVIVAPGHELTCATPSQLRGAFVLRRATTVDLDVSCGEAACDDVVVWRERYQRRGTHLDRLPPGTYDFEVAVHRDAPGEWRGRAHVTVTDLKPRRLRVALAATGTGRSITGQVQPSGVRFEPVVATCGNWVRAARPDPSGRFELHDVPPPPCRVAGFDASTTEVIVERLPAEIELEPTPGWQRIRGQIDAGYRVRP